MNISSITGKITTAIKKIDPLTAATKAAGACALLSVLNESNKIGVRHASRQSKVYEANRAVSLGVGSGKLNYDSPKYNKTKDFIYKNYPFEIGKTINGLKGYLEGFTKGAINNVLTVGFGVLSLVSKRKPVKIVSLAGLLGSIGYNFVRNGTNLFEETNKLE